MNDDVCACGGQIIKVTPNNRLLLVKTSQKLTATNTEATYWGITCTTNERPYYTTKQYLYQGIPASAKRRHLGFHLLCALTGSATDQSLVIYHLLHVSSYRFPLS